MTNNEKLTAAFAEALSIEPSVVVDSLAYHSIPEWDSVSHMILISQLEEVFDVSIDTDDVIDMSSVAKAKEILTKLHIVF
ncbi:MAG: acyl carrier protein [Chitinophagaceae bacterium]